MRDEFSPIANADARYFPIGILNSPKRRVGVIRIGVFEPLEFHELCNSAIAALKIDSAGPCDRNCAKRIDLFASDMLTTALARQAGVLQNAHIDALVVDITGNPGGTDWGEPAARTLAPRLFAEGAAPATLSPAACEPYKHGVVYLAYRPQPF